MRLGSSTPIRQFWFDRTATVIEGAGCLANQASHAKTARLIYTVPAGKRAVLHGIAAMQQTTAAPGTNGESDIVVEYTPNGGAAKALYKNCFLMAGGRFEVSALSLSCFVFMGAGDQIAVYTENASVGGFQSYSWSLSISEIDV